MIHSECTVKYVYIYPWEAILSKALPRDYIVENTTNQVNTQEVGEYIVVA